MIEHLNRRWTLAMMGELEREARKRIPADVIAGNINHLFPIDPPVTGKEVIDVCARNAILVLAR